MRTVRLIVGLVIFSAVFSFGQEISIISWNIQDLGRTKSAEEIEFIAEVLRYHDIVAIQEVVAKDPAGAQAVAKIAEALNRKGDAWDYAVSDPTQSPSPQMKERYAFLWKSSKLTRIGSPRLYSEVSNICVREPFIIQFRHKSYETLFHVVNFHSRVYSEHPEQEVRSLSVIEKHLNSEVVLICGDFNMDEDNPVWELFYRQGFETAVEDSPTTLKRKCSGGEYLNHSIDNIYFDSDHISRTKGYVFDYVQSCENIPIARRVSDHLPVVLFFEIQP